MTAVAEPLVKRELISMAGSVPSRMRGRKPIAHSTVTMKLTSDEAVEKCLRQLQASDDRLAATPQAYDWSPVTNETTEGVPGGTVEFGVYWYDQTFFNEKKDIYLDKKHVRMFTAFDADDSVIEVTHYARVN